MDVYIYVEYKIYVWNIDIYILYTHIPYICSIFHIYIYIYIFHIYIYIHRISDRDMSLSQTQICLSQTQISLSQTQLRQLACPKSIKIVTNGVPVAPFELKLGQNESYGLQEPF